MDVIGRALALAAVLMAASMFPVGAAMAAGGVGAAYALQVDLKDRPALQRGARMFVNYCLSCHSAAFMRYNRMGADLGLSDAQVEQNLMFAGEKIGDRMEVAARSDDLERWLEAAPPDLSVVARARGPSWLYGFLMSYYIVDDASRPTGVDNLVFPGTAMPHVLASLQGIQERVEHDQGDEQNAAHPAPELELVEPGLMTAAEYRRAVRDLVTFLAYMGEPAKLQRQSLGLWVLLFLVVLLVPSYLLYKEYWKDVH